MLASLSIVVLAEVVDEVLADEARRAGKLLDDGDEAPERGLPVAADEQQPRRKQHPPWVPAIRGAAAGVGEEHRGEIGAIGGPTEARVARAGEVEPDLTRLKRQVGPTRRELQEIAEIVGWLGLTERRHAEQRGPRFGAAAETDLRQAQQALKALVGLRRVTRHYGCVQRASEVGATAARVLPGQSEGLLGAVTGWG